jgi:hypothetical protein
MDDDDQFSENNVAFRMQEGSRSEAYKKGA